MKNYDMNIKFQLRKFGLLPSLPSKTLKGTVPRDFRIPVFYEAVPPMGQYAGEAGQAKVLVKHSVENLVTVSVYVVE
jgi:hypothetical protein